MPSLERVKNDVLSKASTYLRESFNLDDQYEIDSYKVTDKEIVVDMDGPFGISIKAGIPLSVLYPPRDYPEGQGELFVTQDARTAEQMVAGAILHLQAKMVDGSGVVVTPGDTGEFEIPRNCNTCQHQDRDPELVQSPSGPCGLNEAHNCGDDWKLWEPVAPVEMERHCSTCLHAAELEEGAAGTVVCQITNFLICNPDNGFVKWEAKLPVISEFTAEEINRILEDGDDDAASQFVFGDGSGTDENPFGHIGDDDELGVGEGECLGDGAPGVREEK